MEEISKNIDGIRNMLKALKAKKYAIINPELVALDEYVKGLYLKVLCTVIQYENEPSEKQIMYLRRIVNGIGIDDTTEECMRKALEISQDDMQEFLSIFGQLSCKYYFAIDGIILSTLGKRNASGYDYLAEILELLEINEADLKYICMITKSILQQNSSLYDQAKELVNVRVEKLNFASYIYSYYAGAIVDTDTEKHYFVKDKDRSLDIIYPSCYRERRVIFENLILNVNEHWLFEGCEEVIFKDCYIVGNDKYFTFNRVGKIVFNSCEVKKFTDSVARISSVNNFIIDKSVFLECGRTENGNVFGGVFFINGTKTDSVKVLNSKFLNCYVSKRSNESYCGATGALMAFGGDSCNSKIIKIKNNEFIGCDCINNEYFTEALIYNFKGKKIHENNKYSGKLQKLFN